MSSAWYPLKFVPIYKEKPWGGRRLQELFGKPVPPGQVGESWEISAHPEGPGVVAEGPLGGRRLADLAEEHPRELMGERIAARGTRFPVLIKLLDAQEVLSVQVHPDDAYAAAHTDDLGKEECWYVVRVGPNGLVYKGLRRKLSRGEFLSAIREKRFGEILNAFRPEVGDMVYLPARTLHTVEDIVFAEVQQSSDLTYRVYDWDRVDADGNGRTLHLDEALAVAELAPPAENAAAPVALDRETTRLADSAKFRVDCVETARARDIPVGPDAFRALVFLAGYGSTEGVGYRAGDCLLVPAAMEKVTVSPQVRSKYLVVEPR